MITLLLCLSASLAFAADPIHVAVACQPSDKELLIKCLVTLRERKTQKPVTGNLRVNVGADMPSMPLAHHIPDVQALPTEVAGEYVASIQLAMLGKWAIRVDVSGDGTGHHLHVQDFRPAKRDKIRSPR